MLTRQEENLSSSQCRCGGIATKGDGLRQNEMVCKDCGMSWAVSECWSCAATIDSRDSALCPGCHWYVCDHCQAHEEECMEEKRRFAPLFGFGRAFS